VRLLAIAVAFSCICVVMGQSLSGTYKPPGSAGADWSINSHQTLIWSGTPYLPIGTVSDPDKKSLEAANAEGFSDVIVDLPTSSPGWQEAISTLESLHMHYLIRLSSLAPMAEGIAVDPSSYRISNPSGIEHINIPLPGASQALVVSALKRDGSMLKWAMEPVIQDRLICDFKVPGEDAVILIYPQEPSLGQPDYWEGLDAQRDSLLETLRSNRTGPGLRGFVNPLGQTITFRGARPTFVPQSHAFRSEFASFLENKYRNVVGVLRAWSMPSGMISSNETGDDKKSILNFDQVAKFVPMWSGSRGIGQVYDPEKKSMYTCDNGSSAIWKDIAACINMAEARRFERMVASIREIDNVPVVQEWSGWSAPYEGGAPSVEGVGMKSTGSTLSQLADTAARAASSDLRWSTPGWLPATDVDVTQDAAGKISGIAEDLTSMGARGIFFRTKSPLLIKEISATAKSRAGDVSASMVSPAPIYYPENATNPAQTQRLPGGYWWLPAPYDGDRLDYGDGFYAYRMATPKGTTLTIWSDSTRRVSLKMFSTKGITSSNLSGSDKDIKVTKQDIELTLSQSPLVISNIDEVPVPEPAYLQTLTEIFVLMAQAKAESRDLTQATMLITDAKLSYARNPGGSFLTMRRLLHDLDSFLGRFSWTELELSQETNFSEVVVAPGCSNNETIDLHPLVDSPSGFYANYEVPVRTTQDQEVWLAARIRPEDRPYVTLDVSGQKLSIQGSPIGLYGQGYGWYHLGTTKNALGIARFKLLVSGGTPDLSADAIMFAPTGFKPDGLIRPEIVIDPSNMPKKTRTRRKSRRGDPSDEGP
jgi:hypothetical protein